MSDTNDITGLSPLNAARIGTLNALLINDAVLGESLDLSRVRWYNPEALAFDGAAPGDDGADTLVTPFVLLALPVTDFARASCTLDVTFVATAEGALQIYLERLEEGATIYTLPVVLHLDGGIDAADAVRVIVHTVRFADLES